MSGAPGSRYEEAFARWREIVGEAHARGDSAAIAPYERNTFGVSRKVAGIIRPADTREVRACARIASECGVPLYPISAGKNWGYGAALPVRDGCVILDLSAMNRIVEHSEEMGYLTLEPGVTFEEAHEFLLAQRSNLMLNVTGAPPCTSVVGNTLERGLGSGPYGDRWQFVCGLEVVLAGGQCIHTGFGRFANARTHRLFRAGVGPVLDGLFSQSNLGIVTQMTVWLFPKQPCFDLYQLSVRAHAGIGALIEAVRALRFERTIDAAVSIWNDYRAMSMHAQYPWAATGGQVPLSREMFERIQGEKKINRWLGAFATYSPTEALREARRARISQVLLPAVDALRIHGFADGNLCDSHVAKGTEETIGAFGEPAIAAQLWQGVPRWSSARSSYWRKEMPIPKDPELDLLGDDCGVIWTVPVVPLSGAEVRRAVEAIERICFEAGFEPMLSLISQHERTAYIVAMLLYDKRNAEHDRRAVECSHRLITALSDLGYYPYRLGVQAMASLPAPDDDTREALRVIKQALDPQGILAPGRYEPAPE